MVSTLFYNMAVNFDVIVACSHNGGIGYRGKLPWHLKNDLKRFYRLTSTVSGDGKRKNVVIMGRKTWESLPNGPLRGRLNIVLTRSPEMITNSPNEDVMAFCDLQSALDQLQSMASVLDRVFVIGGQQLYDIAIDHPYCNRVYVTLVYHDSMFGDYDAWFPIYRVMMEFNVINREDGDDPHTEYIVFER